MKKKGFQIKEFIEIPAALLGAVIGQLSSILLKHLPIGEIIVNTLTGWLLGWCIAWLLDKMKPATSDAAKQARNDNWKFRFAIASILGFFGMVVSSNGPDIIKKLIDSFVKS